MKTVLLIFFISLSSLLIHGYTFSTGDQSVSIPQVIRRLDSSLFIKDPLIKAPEGKFSSFFSLMASILKLTQLDIEWLYFALYFIFHFWVIWQIYQLSFSLTKKQPIALLAASLLALPRFVAGTTITTLDISWLPRFFILPLFLIGVKNSFSGDYFPAIAITGLILFIHPFSAIILGLLIGGCLLLGRYSWRQRFLTGLFGLVPVAIFLSLKLPQFLSQSNPFIMPPDWYQILILRLDYNFVSQWQITGWASLALTLTLISLFLIYLPQTQLAQAIKKSLIVAILTSLIHITAGEIFKITWVLQLQLLRVWLIPTFLAYIAAAVIIGKIWSPKLFISKMLALALYIALLTNFGRLNLSSVEFPRQNTSDWVQVQHWIKTHTPPDALFITPPQRHGFRIHSHRATVVEVKDGSSGLYSYQFAKDWQQSLAEIYPLNPKSTPELLGLKQRFKADYLLTFTDYPHDSLIPLFRNQTWVVYKL